ncbi:glycoside hydrolase family 18 protein [Auriscalpium vulgare]|uniref:Glycoside hydrolase family 18 protein n=1 Tax=Auriscalpium vulgare TaxID=40419 RepID=A0ACB8SAG2_9AGAM|nr:glycoside hydrolase family 18 protein [Auriscalpium vulgare]
MFLAFYLLICFTLVRAAPTCSLVAASNSVQPSVVSGSSTNSTNGTASGSGSIVASTWYAAWHSSQFTLEDVSWSKYSSVIYAFATTTPDVNTIGLQPSDTELLPQFVQAAQQNNVNAILSIGGWTGSQYFSPAVATAANRTAFAQAVMAVVKQYSLDGIEFDWEYPSKQGIGCNMLSSSDSSNFLSFLQTLRSQDGAQNLVLSAAVSVTPFVGPDGTPLSDVSGFASVLDYIEVMNYDIWGSWSNTVGPNAPLDDSCAPTQAGSAMSAVKAWTGAGFPANQIILGVASYGHSFDVASSAAVSGSSGSLTLYPAFDKSQQPAGDSWDGTAGGVDQCGNPNVVGGVFDFWGLIDGGFLTSNGTAANGIDYTFDNCSQTPFVYNPTTQVMVSYDDATSFTAKGQYISQAGLAGFAMWEAGGDSQDILLDAISSGIGIDDDC